MASDPSLVSTLAALPLFRHLGDGVMTSLAALAERRTLDRGETVFLAGQPARAFFAVETGGVRLHRLGPDGREQVLLGVRPGHSFAEAAVIHHGRYPVHAVATEQPTCLVSIDGAGFIALLHNEPEVAITVVGNLSQRLLTLVQRVEELSEPNAEVRLARLLLRLPAEDTTGPDGSLTVLLPAAKKEVAARLAMTPETLSRLLRRWREAGHVRVDGRRIALHDTGALTHIAHDA